MAQTCSKLIHPQINLAHRTPDIAELKHSDEDRHRFAHIRVESLRHPAGPSSVQVWRRMAPRFRVAGHYNQEKGGAEKRPEGALSVGTPPIARANLLNALNALHVCNALQKRARKRMAAKKRDSRYGVRVRRPSGGARSARTLASCEPTCSARLPHSVVACDACELNCRQIHPRCTSP